MTQIASGERIQLRISGARGESYAAAARRTGSIGGVAIPSDATDQEVLDAVAEAAGANTATLAARDAAITASDLAQLAAASAPGVYPDSATGAAAVNEGDSFWAEDDGEVVLYRKVSGVAEEVARILSSGSLAGTDGASLVGTADGGTVETRFADMDLSAFFTEQIEKMKREEADARLALRQAPLRERDALRNGTAIDGFPNDIDWHCVYWAGSISGRDDLRTYPGTSSRDGPQQWRDLSGNGIHANAIAASQRPNFFPVGALFNDKATLRFTSGSDVQYLSVVYGMPPLRQPFTMVALFRNNALVSGNDHHLFNVWDPAILSPGKTAFLTNRSGTELSMYAGTHLTGGTPETTAPHFYLAHFNGASSYLERDGVQIASGDAGTNGLDSFNIGAANGGTAPFFGFVALFGFIRGEMTPTQKAQLEAWVASYYGITFS